MTTTTPHRRVLGHSVPKVDALEKVTGRAQFGADVRLPGMLVGKVLRSPHAHARILRIDTSKARALPGVMAVITGNDLPAVPPGTLVYSGPTPVDVYYGSKLLLAREKVLFHGHPVAAVAATSEETAQAALDLIEVEYEPLPVVLDPLEAMEPGAPLLHPDLHTQGPNGKSAAPSNVALHLALGRGDVERGFAEADVVVERTFRTQVVHQGYLEPEAETASVSHDGAVTVWANTQGIFTHRNELAALLGLPLSKVRVVPTEVGGAFGGKSRVKVSPLCVLLSRQAGRPVQITLSREEVLRATLPASAVVATMKVGARRDGTITALQARLVLDAGAFPGSPVASVARRVFAAYRTPNLRIDGYDVVTNKLRLYYYRAPGGTPAAFALESVMDEVAEALGMDPLEFRLHNAPREGDPAPDNAPLGRCGLADVLQQVRQHPAWTVPLKGPNRGRGLAAGVWGSAPGTASCHASLGADGSVSLVLGTVDLSGTRTTLAQVAAEELGLEMADIRVLTGDTDTVAYSDNTSGDKVTYVASKAVRDACQELLGTLKQRAAGHFKVAAQEVAYEGKRFWVRGAPEMQVSLAEVARRSTQAGGAIVGHGSASGMRSAPMAGAHVVDVEVDPETGKVRLLSYTAFQDVGLCVNPTQVEGQLQGGTAQGIGWALMEEYVFDGHGVLLNPTLLDYRIPTALDLPFVSTNIVEVPSEDNPYGIRGAGQVSIMPPAAAIASAIYGATGVRLRELPMTPERVFWALHTPHRSPPASQVKGRAS